MSIFPAKEAHVCGSTREGHTNQRMIFTLASPEKYSFTFPFSMMHRRMILIHFPCISLFSRVIGQRGKIKIGTTDHKIDDCSPIVVHGPIMAAAIRCIITTRRPRFDHSRPQWRTGVTVKVKTGRDWFCYPISAALTCNLCQLSGYM